MENTTGFKWLLVFKCIYFCKSDKELFHKGLHIWYTFYEGSVQYVWYQFLQIRQWATVENMGQLKPKRIV